MFYLFNGEIKREEGHGGKHVIGLPWIEMS